MLMCEGHNEDLQRHIYKLYQDGEMCDLEIVSKDGISFRAHRLVLTASSRHLYNMCIQSAACATYQSDIQSEVLHILLEFCYTGELLVTTDQWTDIQNAAVLLQMYNVLELLNKQSKTGTSQNYPDIGNQSMLTYDNSSISDEQDRTNVEAEPYNSQYKLEGQANIFNNEILDGDQNQQGVIIKQEVQVLHDEGNQLGKSADDKRNVRVTQYKTRSRAKKNKITSVENGIEHDLDPEPRQRKTSAPLTGIIGDRNSAKVHDDDDPDYEPETKSGKKVRVQKRNEIKTRSKGSSRELLNVNVFSENKSNRIFIKIKNSKIEKTVRPRRKRKRKYRKFHKIFIPKSSNRTCPDCNKTFMSSVLLHRHQLSVHFSKNCSQLKHNHIVKLSKQKWDTHSCVISTGNQSLKFECKLCKAKFSKYCQFTMHHRQRHGNNGRQVESWLRYCSVKLAMQKLLVPFAKDRKSNSRSSGKANASGKKYKERTFKCTTCNKMLLTRYTLETHKRNMHGDMSGRVIIRREKFTPSEPLFVCSVCRKSNRSMRALNNHLQIKHKYTSKEANRLQHCMPDSLNCEICEYKTHSLQELKEHVTQIHSFIKYQCPDCPLSFKVLLLMKRHRFMCHVMGKYNFHCQQCSKSFRKGSMLRKHEYFKHGVPHDDIKIFHCEHPGCNYKTYTSTAIKLHQSKHVTEKLFPCEYCGTKLKTKSIHEKHVAKMHLGIRPFLCQVCGLSFGEKHELQSHITNKHSNERNYQCQYCSYSTAVKSTFFTHMFNVHKVRAEEDKRELFKCPHCPFTAILKYRYQTHINGHTNTRNYECKICNKSFVSANTLRSHKQWVHSDKVYSCTQCDYQTKTSQKLNEHIRVQHQLQGFKPYKCPYCTFRCATGGNTRKHVKQVHKGEVVTYLRDDELLAAARMARASGHYASLLNTLSSVQLSHEVSEDEKSELSENILHIAL